MKSNFKLRFLCGTLALSLIMTACGSANTQGTETGSAVSDTQSVSVEQENTEVVGNSSETEETTEVTLTAEEQEWQNYMMANVEVSLNVRAEASADAEVVGQLAKGDRATVLEIGEEWTKISSGNVEGYVSNAYCVYGTDALAYAKENCETVATAIADGLNVRAEANTEGEVVDQLFKGDKIVVDTDAEVVDGWVAVICNGETAYVSAEFVTVGLNVGTALTMEEIAALEASKRVEEDNNDDYDDGDDGSDDEDDSDDDYGYGWINNYSDYEVLAAMVYCESRGEPYECQLAVAAVIMNRVKSSIFPNSIKAVVLQGGQFPPATDGKLKSALQNGKSTASCQSAASAAYGGEDNTDGCLYFNRYNGTREGLRYGNMVFWKSW